MYRGDPRRSAARTRSRPRCAHAAAGVCLLALTGCYQVMSDQPRYDPLESSRFFPDGMAARPLVPGVVPRGEQLNVWQTTSELFRTGMTDGAEAEVLPAELRDMWGDDYELLERGRERYRVFCAHCHDLSGSGQGYVVRRGFPAPPSLHIPRLREAPVGHFFRVISHGYGRMAAHAAQVPVADRWAIAAYLRALQLSQHVPVDELQEDERRALEASRE